MASHTPSFPEIFFRPLLKLSCLLIRDLLDSTNLHMSGPLTLNSRKPKLLGMVEHEKLLEQGFLRPLESVIRQMETVKFDACP